MYITFINQYKQIFKDFSWFDYDVINISFEHDRFGFDCLVILLGLGINIHINYV